MNQWFVILLLPVAAWSGWWIAMRKEARALRADKSRAAYFEGLHFLLNDQTDRAVDVFLNMSGIHPQAIDNQMTLGSLFRKRGELDRALHLHSRLAELPDLSSEQQQAVTFELAQDFAAAGMYLQAQRHLETLVAASYALKAVIPLLLRIYERTQNYPAAIELSRLWMTQGFGGRHLQMAHYYCELAEKAAQQGDDKAALAALDEALALDRDHIRAYWLRARHCVQTQPVNAISSFLAVAERAPAFIPEILPEMAATYAAIGQEAEFHAWLIDSEARYRNLRLTLAAAKMLRNSHPVLAHALVDKCLQERKSPLLLSEWLAHHDNRDAKRLHKFLHASLTPHTIYQCNECGFRQQKMHWHCPACFAWSSFEPLIELKLEEK